MPIVCDEPHRNDQSAQQGIAALVAHFGTPNDLLIWDSSRAPQVNSFAHLTADNIS
jgi:hypothetical protein